MNPQNGTNPSTPADPIDTHDVKMSGASSVEEKVSAAKKAAAASVASFSAKASSAIKDHPIAALGIAFGLGYFLMRLVRR